MSQNILDTIGLFSAWWSKRTKKSVLNYGPIAALGVDARNLLMYFCWNEETFNSTMFQKILNSKIDPRANTAYGEQNYVLV